MTDRPVIDLNADLGEGSGHDDALLELVTSANVACGAHAGDAATMRRTCAAALERGVVIGAHPGYPDRAGFGRVAMDLPAVELGATLAAQYGGLAAAAASVGTAVRYVKAHGALYHRAAVDQEVAGLVADAAGGLAVLGPPGAVPAPAGHSPARMVVEGFADRGYLVDGNGRPGLVPRGTPGAILAHDEAVAQAVSLATTGLAYAPGGAPVAVHPASLCVHGDTPGAVELARAIRMELERAGLLIEAFA